MQEKLFQFLWKYQYFNKSDLVTTNGQPITVINPGIQNTDQGPDFLQARIKIADTIWAGNLELHLKSSDWLLHHHQNDTHYHKIILHIVWENDKTITDEYNQPMVTLELKDRIARTMIETYSNWQLNNKTIPCGEQSALVPDIVKNNWIERLSVERLTNKVSYIRQLLDKSNNHWEEVFWIILSRYFGGYKNADCFQQMAESLSINILAKHKKQIHQLECLLMGQANLLHQQAEDKYTQLLQNEYAFLSKKYRLKPVSKLPTFLRMRPGSFPSIRLAQLAALINHSNHLFSRILLIEKLPDLYHLFKTAPNLYWETHYILGKECESTDKTIGDNHIHVLIINVIIPIVFAHGQLQGIEGHKQKALDWLQALKPEANAVTGQFKPLGFECNNAAESQGLLELYNNYCTPVNCLNCGIGHSILKKAGVA
ncbi:DUF2851 family protein [Polluticaenibacter yanchengensis]|uniref:DUF2851 family protein n=1 Tax=Polluticaenibacter yanchengensis TaxID=3014562 RepID=A0ABT4UGP9_9BACT|nr:DUF2851 family protein [Chitinophagaceae bacterium LY-5]